ncbi:MAG: hypothetical protein EAZ08_01740 [Cytophagales bacterium]|nr:MAG: hypothetical protein EAZ08_01740 [Cytophagales bacterium]
MGSLTAIFAQKNYEGKVDYGNYQYTYQLKAMAKQNNKYYLKISILDKDNTSPTVYQSFVNTEGVLAKGKQYKIFVMYAEKIEENWKTDPTSHVELIFDLADNLLKHSNRGIVVKKEAEELTDILDIDLAKDPLTEAKAIDYAMQFIVLNYNQLFGNYAISSPEKKPVKQIGKRNTVFVSANDAANTSRDTVSVRGKNYAYILTKTEKNKYNLEVKLVKQGADIVDEEIVYSSDIEVTDDTEKKKIYTVKILYAQGKGYTWRTTPQSFVQTDFNFHKKLTRLQVFGKLKESQTGKFVPITKFTDKHQYTQQDMLTESIRFFVRNFNKAMLK